MKRTLFDDVEKVYFSIPCTSNDNCKYCKNKLICDIIQNFLKSLRKFY